MQETDDEAMRRPLRWLATACCVALALLLARLPDVCTASEPSQSCPRPLPLTIEAQLLDETRPAHLGTSLAPWKARTLQKALDEVVPSAWAHVTSSAQSCLARQCQRRLRPVNLVLRAAQSYGPWKAPWEPDLAEARADGGLSEWDPHYYVTHHWSYYGQQILAMQPGDTVTVNGTTFQVEDVFDYPKDSRLYEIYALTGEDATVLQTCVPSDDYNRIVYGR